MGQTYPDGSSFPDGPKGANCVTCYCLEGRMECPTVSCACKLGAAGEQVSLTFGLTGGLVAYQDSAMLTSTGGYLYSRTPAGTTTPSASCMPALPTCLGKNVDIGDIRKDLEDADVLIALATQGPPIYGVDSRPVDGSIFEVKLSSGGGFLVGADCPPSSSSCRPVPPGIAKLVTDLQALNQQQLGDPSCAFAWPSP